MYFTSIVLGLPSVSLSRCLTGHVTMPCFCITSTTSRCEAGSENAVRCAGGTVTVTYTTQSFDEIAETVRVSKSCNPNLHHPPFTFTLNTLTSPEQRPSAPSSR